MEQLLNRIRDGLSRGAYPNERAVSTSIVVPILRELGWDDSDPDQVMPEHSTGRGRVDYALCCPPHPPIAFIEVKGVGRSTEADRQLFEYAFHEGVPLAILTDGWEWSFYLPAEQGSYDERRVYQLVLTERSVDECAQRLQRYLKLDRLVSGEAIEAARKDYRDARSRREASKNIPKAWAELITEPDGLLIDLLLERTEALCGYRPELEEVERFFLNYSIRPGNSPLVQPSILTAVPTQTSSPRSKSAGLIPISGKASWQVRDEGGITRNAVEAFKAYVESILSQFPDRTDHILAAARTRSRANIGLTPEDIYPQRPDLAKNSRSLASGF